MLVHENLGDFSFLATDTIGPQTHETLFAAAHELLRTKKLLIATIAIFQMGLFSLAVSISLGKYLGFGVSPEARVVSLGSEFIPFGVKRFASEVTETLTTPLVAASIAADVGPERLHEVQFAFAAKRVDHARVVAAVRAEVKLRFWRRVGLNVYEYVVQ